eukprot:5832684-Pyramimonas_sp.AAC.1
MVRRTFTSKTEKASEVLVEEFTPRVQPTEVAVGLECLASNRTLVDEGCSVPRYVAIAVGLNDPDTCTPCKGQIPG